MFLQLKAGPVKVSGKILGSVEGLAMMAKMIINYEEMCNIKLEYVKITKLGKIDFKATGLGPLNSLTSSLVTWLTTMWQNRIIKVIEINVKNIAEKLLNDYVCNNYENAV